MRANFVSVFLTCFFFTQLSFGQCIGTPEQIDYSAPTIIGNTSYFFKFDQINGYQLWKGDANIGNKQLVKVLGGVDDTGSTPINKVVSNGIMYFTAVNGNGQALWKSDGTTAGTVMVKDINPDPNASTIYSIGSLTDVNGTLFFTADDGVNGAKLWKTNGTTAGTVMVKNTGINPGGLVNVNGTVFFSMSDGINGIELWKSDGTAAGTVMVKDIASGSLDSYPSRLINVNGTLFFIARNDNTYKYRLWKSDGTTAGTVMVKDISLNTSITSVIVNNVLFFIANDGINGNELWKSDGTTAGTTMVKDITTGSAGSIINMLTNVNGTVFFSANETSNTRELWKSDGTEAGTVLVKPFSSNRAGISFESFLSFNNQLFFKFRGVYGDELWTSNGTLNGTIQLETYYTNSPIYERSLTIIDGRNGLLYLKIETPERDGTYTKANGIGPSIKIGSKYDMTDLLFYNGSYYGSYDDKVHGVELWKTDFTDNNTQLVKDIYIRFIEEDIKFQTNVNNQFVFLFRDYSLFSHLYKSDGTPAGTGILKPDLEFPSSFYASNFALINTTLFFIASQGNRYDVELWKTNGTTEGTLLVKDIAESTLGSRPSNLTNVNGTLFFQANDFINNRTDNRGIWKSDGTTTNTVKIKDIKIGNPSTLDNLMVDINGVIYFATDGSSGSYNELWKTDGTIAGTMLVKAFPYDATIYNFINLNGKLIFRMADSVYGMELWGSDGTADGTQLIKDIYTGNTSSSPDFLTKKDGFIYFQAKDAAHSTELWRSDGTLAGTTLVKDIDTGMQYNSNYILVPRGSSPRFLTKINDILLFAAENEANGYELWKSDGTEAGTSLVADLNPGTSVTSYGVEYANSSLPRNFVDVNGVAYFKAAYNAAGNLSWFRLATFLTPPTLTSTPSQPVNPGTTVTLSASNCSGIVTWNSGLGTGLTKTVSPSIPTTYAANCTYNSCISPNTSIVVTVIEPCPVSLNLSSTNNDIISGITIKQTNSNTGTIIATNKITGTANVIYQAGKSITLNNGFRADTGTIFKAEIGGCN